MLFPISKNVGKYIPLAFEKLGIKNFQVNADNGQMTVNADISKRKKRAAIRIAKTAELSEKKQLRHLTREDAGNTLSGVIPPSERRYFEKKWL